MQNMRLLFYLFLQSHHRLKVIETLWTEDLSFYAWNLKLTKVKLTEGGFGKHIDGAPISPLFICEMSHINVKIENFIGRVIRNTVTAGSAILLDPRFQQKEGRVSAEIFSTKSQNQNEEILPVLVEILRHPAGDKEHRINILNPKAVVHIFSAERLVDFFRIVMILTPMNEHS